MKVLAPHESLRRLTRAFLIGLAYFISARIGVTLLVQPQNIASFWSPSGLLVGALVIRPMQSWPLTLAAVTAATMGVNLLVGKSPLVSLVFALNNSLEGFTGAWLLLRCCGPRPTLTKVREVLALIVLAGLVNPAFAATLATVVVMMELGVSYFWHVWHGWWTADALGLLNFPRTRAAEDVGVKAGFGFPVLVGKEVVAVLEFFAADAAEPDEALLEVMAHIGTQLGQVVERIRVQEALRASELKFRSVVESANDGIILAHGAGTIIAWNKSARAIFGYDEEAVLGQPLTLLMSERYRDEHRQGLERFRATAQPRVIGRTVELHGRRKNGSEFPLELSLSAWNAGERTFYGGIIRDITERKRVEEEIRRLNAALALRSSSSMPPTRKLKRSRTPSPTTYAHHSGRSPASRASSLKNTRRTSQMTCSVICNEYRTMLRTWGG